MIMKLSDRLFDRLPALIPLVLYISGFFRALLADTL